MKRHIQRILAMGAISCTGTAYGQLEVEVTDIAVSDTVIPGDPNADDLEPGRYVPMHGPISDADASIPEDNGLEPADPQMAERWYRFDMLTGRSVLTPPTVVPPGAGDSGVETGGDPGGPGGPGDGDDGFGPRDMNGLSIVGNPDDYPYRMNVKLVMTFDEPGGTVTRVCSGTMIDSRHVFTAGHCIFNHGRGWADEVMVYPGYEDEDNDGDDWLEDYPYGGSRAIHLYSTSGWVDHEYYGYDIGVLYLDRPVGAITGWMGYGYDNSCSFHKSGTFWNRSYPAEASGGWNGRFMYDRSGDFDSCPALHRVEMSSPSWGGQSGSGAYKFIDGSRYVFSTASTSDRQTQTRFCRLWSTPFYWIRDDTIAAHRPNFCDIVPLWTRFGPTTIQAGERLDWMKYRLHNYTDGCYVDGPVPVDVYLSTNDYISTNDTLIQSRQVMINDLQKMYTAKITADGLMPKIPQDTPPGDYWIGIIFDIEDQNEDNNHTVYWDSFPITVTGAPDLWAQSFAVAGSEFDLGDSMSVGFVVRNIGNVPSSAWTGDFYASSDPQIDDGDYLLASGGAGPLDPGDSFSDGVALTVQGMPPGEYWIGMLVDSEGESDYSNNAVASASAVTIEGCDADWNYDGTLNTQDFVSYLNDYAAGDRRADVSGDGIINTADFVRYLNWYAGGCL